MEPGTRVSGDRGHLAYGKLREERRSAVRKGEVAEGERC
jgi:hypothetical protein